MMLADDLEQLIKEEGKDPKREQITLHPTCHPDSTMIVQYHDGVLLFYCAVCKHAVLKVGVANLAMVELYAIFNEYLERIATDKRMTAVALKMPFPVIQ